MRWHEVVSESPAPAQDRARRPWARRRDDGDAPTHRRGAGTKPWGVAAGPRPAGIPKPLQGGAVLAATLAAAIHAVGAETPQEVEVVNFPEVQAVRGSVQVDGHPEAARLISFEEIVLPPAPPDNPGRMISPGVLEGAGFRSVVASFAGSQSTPASPGRIGVLLVPEIELAGEALQRTGRLLLGHRLEAELRTPEAPYFTGGPLRFDLAFPRYRVFLFNTGERAVQVSAYLYLTE